VDHGTEFTSRVLQDWAYRRGVKPDFIRPGKSTENGHIESFSGRLRDACLNVTQLLSNAPRTARRDLVACRWRSA
jgi:putative transposase